MSFGGRDSAGSMGPVKVGYGVSGWMRPGALLTFWYFTAGKNRIVGASALFALPMASYFWICESSLWGQTYPSNLFFVASITLTLAAWVVLACRRVLVAAVTVTALVGIAAAIAAAKQHAMGMVLHAYDMVFYLSTWSTIGFLWEHFQTYIVVLMAGLVASAIAAVAAYRFDTTRVRRRSALVAVVVLTLVSLLAADLKGERRHMQYYWDGFYLSSFYSSWAETAEALWRGQLIEAAASAPGAPLLPLRECTTVTKPPHIILIHEESVVPPGNFPTLQYDHRLDRMFLSHDGKRHPLRVETYGGASWLTEFSVLTGLSSRSFGGMQQFVQPLMTGKLHDTLPETLGRCGYRNIVMYPLLHNFVSSGKFYASIGVKEMFDAADQHAPSYSERDRFYFGNALDELARHLRNSRQPLFTMILTMATHSPYDETYMPEIDVPGGGPGTDPEMSEFLRRLAMAQIDYDELRGELARRFPGERFLIVHYGDHHPVATRSLLGLDNTMDTEDLVLPADGPGYVTYYAVDGINYQPPPLPDVETLDVPYLPLVILEAARLPLPEAFKERRNLLAACGGRYYACEPRSLVLSFHRRLIDSGLIDAH